MSVANHDLDPIETQEWLDAIESLVRVEGKERAQFLIQQVLKSAKSKGVNLPFGSRTDYVNTITPDQQVAFPGDLVMEERIAVYIRWNALATVLKANKITSELGGHIASYASSSALYEVGNNHFFHAKTDTHGGDLIYSQGHSSPGAYARAFLEGRISEEQLLKFRQEVDGGGLSSYPHPWLMPDFWQFPTVSMGLGPLMAVYQARFMKYLQGRGLVQTEGRKVWAFMGDGEMDEPESRGAISIAAEEGLDNLIYVINCNLQRLDGPVRGNGQIITELEGLFRGAGWNVYKVIWGSGWDELLAKDTSGLLIKLMNETVDGEYQKIRAKDGAYVRAKFFGKYPELLPLVAHKTDEELWRLTRGGHDLQKMYAAYHAATTQANGKPTLVLAKTVKGYGMGSAGEAQNTSHQQKKMPEQSLLDFRDRFSLPMSDEDVKAAKFYKPSEDSEEMQYLHSRRKALGGYLPARTPSTEVLVIPPLSVFDRFLKDSGDREFSTTMAFVQMLGVLLKDKNIGKRVVPIVPDESRTFGMEGLFRQLGIFSSKGQLYEPQDSDQLMFYKEAKDGQVLQEGINEAGAFSTWIAASTSYANHDLTMVPFYIYYSMFGFQRIGDLAWAAGDMRARGFLLGGTAGRTTLAGEGLQHQDGHGHNFAGFIPNCVSYDPTFAYELAVIMQDGMVRMYQNHEDIYYYISVMNENYAHTAMPVGAEAGILKGLYVYREAANPQAALQVQLMGSGTIFREAIAAADLLHKDWGVEASLLSAPSFNELRRDGIAATRHNMLNPTATPQVPFVTQVLQDRQGPVIVATDYIRNYADQIREYVPQQFVVLGTDGFGRSDTRKQLRKFFEVNSYYITVAALQALAIEGKIAASVVAEAIVKYGIDVNKAQPWTV